MTRSAKPWIRSFMQERNRPFEAPVRGFLAALVQNPPGHARFLNMLSMLEHIGSRKIMLSQPVMDEDILQHLAEESRHAHFFKRQAERVAGHALPGYAPDNVTSYGAARMYFGRLDAAIAAQVEPGAAYGWVSMMIELRACWLYAIYHETLQHAQPAISLQGLLAEETRHLDEMYALCGRDDERLLRLGILEAGLITNLWAQIDPGAALMQAA